LARPAVLIAFSHLIYELRLREQLEQLFCRIVARTTASLQEIEKKALCFRDSLRCFCHPAHLIDSSAIILTVALDERVAPAIVTRAQADRASHESEQLAGKSALFAHIIVDLSQ
jgi:hypothetical protein